LSDGVPTTGGSFDDEIATLLAADVNMRAFGVGQAASLTELRKIDPSAKIYVTGEDLLAAVNLNNTTGYPGEEGMAGVSVYLDLNNNGVWNSATEPRAVTLDDDPDTSDFDETGYYRFDNLFAGTYHVREVIPTGHTQTYPGSTLFKHVVVLDSGDIRSGIDFGNAANPFITGIPATQNYVSGSAGVLLATSALVSDADTPIFNGGTLRVRVSANSQTTDILRISHQGNGVGQIGVSGSTISYGGLAIGSFTGGSGSTALLITFNGNATLASVQAVVRRITFRNTLANPSSATRTVEWRLTDGTGGTSALVNESVTIT
jgi:hypothetical protein